MTGTDASARVAVEVLVEQRVIAPVRVGLKDLVRAEDWATPILSTQKDMRQPARELIGYLPERELVTRTGGAFHQEIVAIYLCCHHPFQASPGVADKSDPTIP